MKSDHRIYVAALPYCISRIDSIHDGEEISTAEGRRSMVIEVPVRICSVQLVLVDGKQDKISWDSMLEQNALDEYG